jgi:two-component system, OmpR family, response regulator
MDPLQIALIDDDASLCEMVKDHVAKKFPDSQLTVYATGEEALNGIQQRPDIVILDYQLDSVKADAMNGIQVLSKIKERYSDVPVIFLSSQDRMEVATNTIKYGAYDYITKNETAFHRLELAIANLAERGKLKKSHVVQKTMNMIFWGLLLIWIVYSLYLRFTS